MLLVIVLIRKTILTFDPRYTKSLISYTQLPSVGELGNLLFN